MTDKDFDNASMEIDQYCVNHDIDDYDLFGEIMVENNNDDCDIEFE